MDDQQIPEDGLQLLGFGESFIEELADMLGKTALFAKFEPTELRVLARYCAAYHVPAGRVLFQEAGKSHYMAVLLNGRIDILKQDKLITSVRPGRPLGEMSLVDGYPHSASAKAVEESDIVMFVHSQYDKLCQDHPKLALKFITTLAGLMSLRLRQTTGVLLDHL
jgi:CRP-like cAMP-binding protein